MQQFINKALYTEEIQTHLSSVSKLLSKTISDCSSETCGFIDNSIFSDAKMLRPRILLHSALRIGSIDNNHILFAAAVELIHTASLLHDDVLDSSNYRRSKETINSLHNDKIAIIVGDLLISKAYSILEEINNRNSQCAVTRSIEDMCKGELLQGSLLSNFTITERQYYEIINLKTAKLFSLSASGATIINNSNTSQLQQSIDFGYNFGMAYQIHDDIQDLCGANANKPNAIDIANSVITLPVIHAIKSKKANKDNIELAYKDKDAGKILEILKESGSIAYAKDVADKFLEQASKLLR